MGTIITAIVTSFIGSWLFFYFIKNRNKRIKLKIDELEKEEEKLTKLAKGNTHLIRRAFATLFYIIALIALGLMLNQVPNLFNLNIELKKNVALIVMSIFGSAFIISIVFMNQIYKLDRLSEVRKEIKKKKDKLTEKLD